MIVKLAAHMVSMSPPLSSSPGGQVGLALRRLLGSSAIGASQRSDHGPPSDRLSPVIGHQQATAFESRAALSMKILGHDNQPLTIDEVAALPTRQPK